MTSRMAKFTCQGISHTSFTFIPCQEIEKMFYSAETWLVNCKRYQKEWKFEDTLKCQFQIWDTKVHLFISCTKVQLIHFVIHFHLIHFTNHSPSHSHSPSLVSLILHRNSTSLSFIFLSNPFSEN